MRLSKFSLRSETTNVYDDGDFKLSKVALSHITWNTNALDLHEKRSSVLKSFTQNCPEKNQIVKRCSSCNQQGASTTA